MCQICYLCTERNILCEFYSFFKYLNTNKIIDNATLTSMFYHEANNVLDKSLIHQFSFILVNQMVNET